MTGRENSSSMSGVFAIARDGAILEHADCKENMRLLLIKGRVILILGEKNEKKRKEKKRNYQTSLDGEGTDNKGGFAFSKKELLFLVGERFASFEDSGSGKSKSSS